jgi:hypothetical protein
VFTFHVVDLVVRSEVNDHEGLSGFGKQAPAVKMQVMPMEIGR